MRSPQPGLPQGAQSAYPLLRGRIVGKGGNEDVYACARAPGLLYVSKELLQSFFCREPGRKARKGSKEYQRAERSGYVAANSAAIEAPSDTPSSAACSIPAASITARMSSIR